MKTFSLTVLLNQTSTVLSWAIFCLAKYPECQQKIIDEAIRELGPFFTEEIPFQLEYQPMLKLTFLDCFVKEVLR